MKANRSAAFIGLVASIILDMTLWGTVLPAPDLEAGVLALSFLPNTVGSVPLCNRGDGVLHLSAPSVDDPFVVEEIPQSIAAGECGEVRVAYRSSGDDHGQLTLFSDDPNKPEMHIALIGLNSMEVAADLQRLHADEQGQLHAQFDFHERDYVLALYSAQFDDMDRAAVYDFSLEGPLPIAKPVAAHAIMTRRDSLEMIMRQRERELAARIREQGWVAAKRAAVQYQVGDQRTFVFTETGDVPTQTIEVTVVANNERVVAFVHEDLGEDPGDGVSEPLTTPQIQMLIDQFAEDWDIVVNAFGTPSDVDGDGKVAVVFSRLVGEGKTGGFFEPLSLMPTALGGTGDETDVFYVNLLQVNLNFPRTTLVHEFQHLINFNQHVLVRLGQCEALWLNEGLSLIAEDLVGIGRNGNTAAHTLAFLQEPAAVGLVGEADFFPSGAPQRGAAFLFLQSLIDRLGQGVLLRLVQTGLTDFHNVEEATGESFEELLAFWSAQLYASGNDLVDHPLFNYRSDPLDLSEADGRGFPMPSILNHSLGGPPVYTYQVVREYPHDPTAFTQGLVFDEGVLYESTGNPLGEGSTLRRVELESGQVLEQRDVALPLFAEGLTLLDDRLIQLTWLSNIGLVYDKNSMELLGEFDYPTEGWGITHDGVRLIMSDGTATIYFLDPHSFERIGQLEVWDGDQPVERLNELEYIEGEIYANVWQTDRIARVDPQSGQVLGWIDLSGLLGPDERGQADVLNGIAYDPLEQRLFVTGKWWPKLFEIALVPGGGATAGTLRSRGVNFVRLSGEGVATVEMQTDPQGKIGAVVLPVAKNFVDVAATAPRDFMQGIVLDQLFPLEFTTGQEVEFGGTANDESILFLVFIIGDFSDPEASAIHSFAVSVEDGRFEGSVFFSDHGQAGSYGLAVVDQDFNLLGLTESVQIHPSSGPIQLPTTYFNGMEMDAPLPVALNTGQVWPVSGTVKDKSISEIAFRFFFQPDSSDEPLIVFPFPVEDGRFEGAIHFEDDQAGIYRLSPRFNGQLAGDFSFGGSALRFVVKATSTVVLEDQLSPQAPTFVLAPNFPNPFNSSTVFRFSLPTAAKVELALYNLAGQKLALLVAGTRQAGVYTIHWDGRDSSGRSLASGVYIYQLKAGAKTERRKLLLLR